MEKTNNLNVVEMSRGRLRANENLYRVPKLAHQELTQEMLREYTNYDPETGQFTLIKTSSPRFKNSLPMPLGGGSGPYLNAMVCGIRLPCHVMAVIYMTGKAPDRVQLEVVDHINGNTKDNRWSNLRVVSGGENVRNQKQTKTTTTSGITGVSARGKGFIAYIRVDKKLHYLGSFKTLEEAIAARIKALKAYTRIEEDKNSVLYTALHLNEVTQ